MKIPDANTATAKLLSQFSIPRYNPFPALNFISPPPKAPGAQNKITKNKRRLTPIPAKHRSISSFVKKRSLKNAHNTTAIVNISGILFSCPSFHAVMINTSIHTASTTDFPSTFYPAPFLFYILFRKNFLYNRSFL